MLLLFLQEYAPVLFATLVLLALMFFMRSWAEKQRRLRERTETQGRIRATFARAAEQKQDVDISIPGEDGEEVYLGRGRYLGGHAEGMRLELWVRPSNPVLNHDVMHGYFCLKHIGPYSHYKFTSSMHEYARDGDRVEVIVPWPEFLGHGQHPHFTHTAARESSEALVRLWRALPRDTDAGLGPLQWESIPPTSVVITDIGGEVLTCGLDPAESAHIGEGTLILSRMRLPYPDMDLVELSLAGVVRHLHHTPHLSHDQLEIRWLRWARPGGDMPELEWHYLEEGQHVPLLQSWVQLRA